MLLEHRSLAKLKSTYVDALPRCIHAKTGRVHCSFQQTVTATGRLSCTDQTYKIFQFNGRWSENTSGFYLKGNCLVGLDYSQIELKLWRIFLRIKVC